MATGVAIISDQEEVVGAIETCVNASGKFRLSGKYPSGGLALKTILRRPPAAVLVDFKLRDIAAMECVHGLHLLLPQLLIVLFSCEPELTSFLEALRAGAVGFLDHGVRPEEIVPYLDCPPVWLFPCALAH